MSIIYISRVQLFFSVNWQYTCLLELPWDVASDSGLLSFIKIIIQNNFRLLVEWQWNSPPLPFHTFSFTINPFGRDKKCDDMNYPKYCHSYCIVEIPSLVSFFFFYSWISEVILHSKFLHHTSMTTACYCRVFTFRYQMFYFSTR